MSLPQSTFTWAQGANTGPDAGSAENKTDRLGYELVLELVSGGTKSEPDVHSVYHRCCTVVKNAGYKKAVNSAYASSKVLVGMHMPQNFVGL